MFYLEEIVDYMEKARKNKCNILVHCYMGKSRSASAIIAYLIKYKKYSFESAVKFLKNLRNIINPNFGFVSQLKEYEKLCLEKDSNKK